MASYGDAYTEKELKKLEKQIEDIYQEAHNNISMKMKKFNLNWINNKIPAWQAKLNSGEITQEEYDKWFAGQWFQSQQWQAKEEQIYSVLHNANAEAINILNGGKISVFAENANWTAYTLEHGHEINFGFGLYDSTTVNQLIKDNPNILPKWKVNEQKDYVWNKKKANSVITQGIIQGKKFDEIAKDMTDKLSAQNYNLMKTHTRTAMTAAQNAGRYQALMDAKALGIDVYKEWMATLDGRTRDSHRHLDGEKQKVGDKWHPFKFSNGCRYPGDPEGPPWEVYNCRCTLVGDIDDYPADYERRDNIEGVPIKNMTYDEWYEAKQEYKKIVDQYGTLEEAEKKLESLKHLASNAPTDMNKVFSNIWQNDVTYHDWESKKDSIQGKLDYFDQQIKKHTQGVIDKIGNYAGISGYDAEDVFDTFSKYEKFGDISDKDLKHLLGILDEDDIYNTWLAHSKGFHAEQLDKFIELKEELEEFQKYGSKYSKLFKDIEEAEQRVQLLTPKSFSSITYNEEAYSQARKDAAKWFTNKTYREGDKYYTSWSREVHAKATSAEHSAYYSYTSASGGFNRPLAGFDYSKNNVYGDGWNPNNYVGPGKVDLNNEGKGRAIENLTSFIEKSKTPDDIWIQTAQNYGTLEGEHGFLGIDYGTLEQMRGDDKVLQQFVGTTAEFPQFLSGSINRGGGTYTPGSMRINIYVPKGSEALYVLEDGAFGKAEHEIILQRGGTYRITKMYWGQDIENGGTKLIVDMELLTNMGYNKFK